ncbi:MAG: GTPase Era [bacterium]
MKSGLIAVIGRPNVGKSTLLNRLVGEKLSIISPKPQTTWQRLHGILTTEDAQFVFIDTPGLETDKNSNFISILKKISITAMNDADVIAHIVEPIITDREEAIQKELKKILQKPKVLIINKIDLKKDKRLLLPVIEHYAKTGLYNDIIPLSAITGDGVDTLLKELKKYLPNDGMLYSNDTITDKYEKELVAEIIREKLFYFTREEIPYSSACVVDRFDETQRDRIVKIYATIYVEKMSQKGILIGANGSMLKRIGTSARKDIERLLGTKVYLSLYVKVMKNWKKDKQFLKEIGLLK